MQTQVSSTGLGEDLPGARVDGTGDPYSGLVSEAGGRYTPSRFYQDTPNQGLPPGPNVTGQSDVSKEGSAPLECHGVEGDHLVSPNGGSPQTVPRGQNAGIAGAVPARVPSPNVGGGDQVSGSDSITQVRPPPPVEVYPFALIRGEDGGLLLNQRGLDISRSHHEEWTLRGEEWWRAVDLLQGKGEQLPGPRAECQGSSHKGYVLYANGPGPRVDNPVGKERSMFDRAYGGWVKAVNKVRGPAPPVPDPAPVPPSAVPAAGRRVLGRDKPTLPPPRGGRKGGGLGRSRPSTLPGIGAPRERHLPLGCGSGSSASSSPGGGICQVSHDGGVQQAGGGARESLPVSSARGGGVRRPPRDPRVTGALATLRSKFALGEAITRDHWQLAEAIVADPEFGWECARLALGRGDKVVVPGRNVPARGTAPGAQGRDVMSSIPDALLRGVTHGVPLRVRDACVAGDPDFIQEVWVDVAAEGLAALAMVAATAATVPAYTAVLVRLRQAAGEGALGSVRSIATGLASAVASVPMEAPASRVHQVLPFGEKPTLEAAVTGGLPPSVVHTGAVGGDDRGMLAARACTHHRCVQVPDRDGNGVVVLCAGVDARGCDRAQAIGALAQDFWSMASLGPDLSLQAWEDGGRDRFISTIQCFEAEVNSAWATSPVGVSCVRMPASGATSGTTSPLMGRKDGTPGGETRPPQAVPDQGSDKDGFSAPDHVSGS
nr:MAG: hypothetical protein [Totiviridae sp.]